MSRINIYGEEITTETQLVQKPAMQPDGTMRTYYGVRTMLISPPELHHTPDDDDRSGVTFFIPWTAAGGHDFNLMLTMLDQLKYQVRQAQAMDELRRRDQEETALQELKDLDAMHHAVTVHDEAQIND